MCRGGGGGVGWCDGAGSTSSAVWIKVGQGPTTLAVGAGGGLFGQFFLSSIISLFFLPLSGRRPDKDLNTVSKGR